MADPAPPTDYSGRWKTQWRDSSGKQRWKSFGGVAKVTRAAANRAYRLWLANEYHANPAVADPSRILTVGQLCDRYHAHAINYYVDAKGSQTREAVNIEHAIRHLRDAHEGMSAYEVGLTELRGVRDIMEVTLSRSVINQRVNKIRAMYRWAAENELIPDGEWMKLKHLQPLRAGRSTARETEPVMPVPQAHIDSVLAVCGDLTATLIRLQLLTAMRPGEAVAMYGPDIDTSGDVWWYKPGSHKNTWRGHDREVPLGPQAQALLTLKAGYLFPPEPTDRRLETRPHLSVNNYYQRVRRACVRVFGKDGDANYWGPGRLRHNALTAIRREAGLEAAQVFAGHAKADTTQVYAERNRQAAALAARKIG